MVNDWFFCPLLPLFCFVFQICIFIAIRIMIGFFSVYSFATFFFDNVHWNPLNSLQQLDINDIYELIFKCRCCCRHHHCCCCCCGRCCFCRWWRCIFSSIFDFNCIKKYRYTYKFGWIVWIRGNDDIDCDCFR